MTSSREILIIEDSPADVRLMREALRSLEQPVSICALDDGEQVMRYLQRQGEYAQSPLPAMVYLDFNLPRTDSRELLRFIKRDPVLQELIVAVLSSSSQEEVIREAYALQANCYLSKPLDLSDFLYTIRAATTFWLNVSSQRGPCEELAGFDRS